MEPPLVEVEPPLVDEVEETPPVEVEAVKMTLPLDPPKKPPLKKPPPKPKPPPLDPPTMIGGAPPPDEPISMGGRGGGGA
ncbi:MAG: hypothetical protein QOH81_142 [Sphingomonadales bacterium]|nr:hypothetical protein [Sphingomonadales bacterium]